MAGFNKLGCGADAMEVAPPVGEIVKQEANDAVPVKAKRVFSGGSTRSPEDDFDFSTLNESPLKNDEELKTEEAQEVDGFRPPAVKVEGNEIIFTAEVTAIKGERDDWKAFTGSVSVHNPADFTLITGADPTEWQMNMMRGTAGLPVPVSVSGKVLMGGLLSMGDVARLSGKFVTHQQYGRQFNASAIIRTSALNMTAPMVESWLKGLEGVGEKTVRILTDTFGANLTKIMDNGPALEAALRDAGLKRPLSMAEFIVKSWGELNKEDCAVDLLWLGQLGFNSKQSETIVDRYKGALRTQVMEDPWALTELDGIGFATADKAALALGCDPMSPSRLKACMTQIFNDAADNDGHCGLPTSYLGSEMKRLLNVDTGIVAAIIKGEVADGVLKVSNFDGAVLLYREKILRMEREIIDSLVEALEWNELARDITEDQVDALVNEVCTIAEGEEKPLNLGQRSAVEMLVSNGLGLLSGPPGSGKTTVLKYACRALDNHNWNVHGHGPVIVGGALAGRAAKRMSECMAPVEVEPKTIHRLLGWHPERIWIPCLQCHITSTEFGLLMSEEVMPSDLVEHFNYVANQLGGLEQAIGKVVTEASRRENQRGGGFTFDRHRKLPADIVLIDESSMLDVGLFHAVVTATDLQTSKLFFIGDKDQLAPIGPGRVYGDLVSNPYMPKTILTENKRSVKAISQAFSAVNEGGMPPKDIDNGTWKMLFTSTPEDTVATVKQAVREAMDNGFSPATGDLVVMTPTKVGVTGSYVFNQIIKDIVNPPRADEPLITGVKTAEIQATFSPRDRVMQRENDYKKGIMNGEVGIITDIRLSSESRGSKIKNPEYDIDVDFNGLGVTPYKKSDFVTAVDLAYSASVHKLQGSEARFAITVMTDKNYYTVSRGMAYTAFSRGKEKSWFIGSERVLKKALSVIDIDARHTHFAARLTATIKGSGGITHEMVSKPSASNDKTTSRVLTPKFG